MLVEPDEVADPVGMRVARDDDIVGNVVFVQGLKCSITIRLVTILAIQSVLKQRLVVEWKDR